MKSYIIIILVIIFSIIIFVSIHSSKKTTQRKRLQLYFNMIDNMKPNYNHIQEMVGDINFYYINLNKTIYRNDYLKSQIQHLQLNNIYRIEGVYGLDVVNGVYTFSNGTKLFVKSHHTYSNKSELGCILSHFVALYTSYMNGDQYSVILEDDVYLNIIKVWKKSLGDFIDGAPNNWKIIQLYESSIIDDKKWYEIRDKHTCYGTLAYLINREGMKSVLDYIDMKSDDSGNMYCYIKEIKSYNKGWDYTADNYIYNIVRDSVYTTKSKFVTNNMLGKSSIKSGDFWEHYFSYSRDEMVIKNSGDILEKYYMKDVNMINDYIDAVLIINLEKDRDRYDNLYEQLLRYNVNENKIYRIDAVYEKMNGHLGCGKSHVKALEFAIEKDFDNVLIIEDDFTFTAKTKYIGEILTTFFTNIKEWDVLDIEKKLTRHSTYRSNTRGIYNIKSVNCTGAFIVNKHYYTKLLNNRQEAVDLLQKETDSYLETCGDNCKKITRTKYAIDKWQKKIQNVDNWYVLKPHLGKQLSLLSGNSNTENFLIKDIHMILITNKGAFIGLIALVNSILQNCNEDDLNNLYFHLLIDLDETEKLENLIKQSKLTFNYDIAEFDNPSSRKFIIDTMNTNIHDGIKHILNFGRFFISSIYNNLNKIIYIDCDMICQGDITELRDEYFHLLDDDNQLLAVKCDNQGDVSKTVLDKYNISSHNFKYFNAGIFITSLANWRQNNIEDQLLYWMKENKEHSLFNLGTQPILNITFINKVKYIDSRWNTLGLGGNTRLRRKYLNNGKILHWNGARKWWNKDGLYKHYGEKYNVIRETYIERYKPDNWKDLSFTDKLKIYGDSLNKEHSFYADKLRVKDWVNSLNIDGLYTPKTIKILDKRKKILDISTLPTDCVIKSNNSSGPIIIIKDSKVQVMKPKTTYRNWVRKAIKPHITKHEKHYTHIKPEIFVEEYIADGVEYKFFCFNGVIKFYYYTGRNGERCRNIYDGVSNSLLPFTINHPNCTVNTLPDNIEDMKEIAENLSQQFEFIRVDLYNVDSKIYFGELTFVPDAGINFKFSSEYYNKLYGSYWK